MLGLPRSTFFDWARLEGGGKAERPPVTTPKAHHITPDERAAVIAFAREHLDKYYVFSGHTCYSYDLIMDHVFCLIC